MDPSRKRKVRLVVALCAALLLAGALIYTSFSDSTEARAPGRARGVGPPGNLLPRRPACASDGDPRSGVRAVGLLVQARLAELLDRHARLLQVHGDVVEPGGLAALVGVPALGLLERGA